LSYAEEDNAIADEIVGWLNQQPGIDAYHWRDPRQQGRRIVETIEEEIGKADAFLALLSPHYLTSPWCRLEKDLAVHREMDRQAINPEDTRPFIYVLEIVKTPPHAAGSLRDFAWFDVSAREWREERLRNLADRLREESAAAPEDPATGGPSQEPPPPIFRNRGQELNLLKNALTNTGGQHFWLVLAPPQLGKSWFLDRLSTSLASEHNWVTKLVDLGDEPDARGDAALLLGRLFDLPGPVTIDQLDVEEIASRISAGRRPYLCLLDSANLLEKEPAKQLRVTFSQIYWLVRRAGNPDVRLAFVAASRRREREWRGVTPQPAISLQPLTEFDVYVVERALRDMAAEHGHHALGDAWFQASARRVHELSEGLPALLIQCLRWIQQRAFVMPSQEQRLFEKLARPYIEQELLSPKSLFPQGSAEVEEEELARRQRALEQAFRVLAPYRLLTQSHLRHCLTSDHDFKEALNALGWSVEALWRAIGDTALLVSLDEPWQVICPAIRRLFYRFYYTSDDARRDAHRAAIEFYGGWLHEPAGKEQSVVLVERLWHETSLLLLERPAGLDETLVQIALDLCETIRAPHAFSSEDLRRYAAERMQSDEEFQVALEPHPGLFDRLVEIVEPPS
jgi:hypothetical protein